MLFLSLTAASAPVGSIPVKILGRIKPVPGGVELGWPATTVEGRFQGTAVSVTLTAPTDRFRISIDGKPVALPAKLNGQPIIIDGLSPGAHRILIEKTSENHVDPPARFGGIRPLGNTVGLPPPPVRRDRQIEIVGDSYAAGYGNLAPGHACTRAQVEEWTDSSQAFGPIVARRFGADYRIIGFSGAGVVRNAAGQRPERTFADIYPRLLPAGGESVPAREPDWQPQIVVLALGWNDFSIPLKRGERWADKAALQRDFTVKYVALAETIRKRYPTAQFIVLGRVELLPRLQTVAFVLQKKWGGKVPLLSEGNMNLAGCERHPSVQDHRQIAEILAPELARIWRK